MDADLLYRTLPFVSLALVLLGWMLIELLQTPREEWDRLTLTIVFAGLAACCYLTSLAVNYAPVGVTVRDWVFESIRVSLLFTIPGVPVVWINVWRAFRARRKGLYRKKKVYDLPADQSDH